MVTSQPEGKSDGFTDVLLDTPKVSPLGAAQVTPTPDTHTTQSSSQYQQDISLDSAALPAWETDSEGSGADEGDGDGYSGDEQQVHYVDQHAHAH